MTAQCAVPDCYAVAEIVVRDLDGDELDVCREHWSEAMHRSGGLIRGVRLIERPGCFITGCDSGAAAVIDDTEGLPRPVCELHWDDLSWVGVPAGVIYNRGPGWSYG